MENLLEIDNLTFSRSGRIIYDDISLRIVKGKTTAIMGPSGIAVSYTHLRAHET